MTNPFARERRKALDHAASDCLTKQMVVGTICLIAIMIVGTLCYCQIVGTEIFDSTDRLGNLIIGGILAILAKTGVDALAKPNTPTGTPGDPIRAEVENAPEKDLTVTEKEAEMNSETNLSAGEKFADDLK